MPVGSLALSLELEPWVHDIIIHQDRGKHVVVLVGGENLDLVTLSLRLVLRVLKELELEIESLWGWLLLFNHLDVKLVIFLVELPEVGIHVDFLSGWSLLSGSILSLLVRLPVLSIALSAITFVASFLSFDILGVSTSLSVAIA